MAHRKRKYAADVKQAKVNALAFDKSPAARQARIADVTHSQWKKRIATNVSGFWKGEHARMA